MGTPVNLMQNNSKAPQTAASKIITKLSQQLYKTGLIRTAHDNCEEGWLYCRAFALSYNSFSFVYLIKWQLSVQYYKYTFLQPLVFFSCCLQFCGFLFCRTFKQTLIFTSLAFTDCKK